MTQTQLPVDLPISRSYAKLAGSRHYFTGTPCVNGHVAIRATTSGHCLQCDRDRAKVRLLDPAYRDVHRKLTLEYKRRVLGDPIRKTAIRERELFLQNNSPARKKARKVADQLRNQRPDVVEKRKHREANLTDRQVAMARARCAMRRASKANASKITKTLGLHNEVNEFYVLARSMTKSTGIKHEVDHIIPLRSSVVCGLHVPWNLRVVTRSYNARKYNMIEDVDYGDI